MAVAGRGGGAPEDKLSVRNGGGMRCAVGALQRASFFTLEITLRLGGRYEGLDECRHGLLLLEDTLARISIQTVHS